MRHTLLEENMSKKHSRGVLKIWPLLLQHIAERTLVIIAHFRRLWKAGRVSRAETAVLGAKRATLFTTSGALAQGTKNAVLEPVICTCSMISVRARQNTDELRTFQIRQANGTLFKIVAIGIGACWLTTAIAFAIPHWHGNLEQETAAAKIVSTLLTDRMDIDTIWRKSCLKPIGQLAYFL
eukprot:gnl/TRDRNA2_/TRDRNA2_80173_c0_seq1.p3 gnl/TRDRNA2_/TRDRNA2_80173_c0~~gnl/TRDRNA2_/TRDRNA2_80173_c0_seq1.p3  ORF type:complete len:181 (-),score=13.17 gnl/TRDRNA2_/TRDRNA2_80173_c0_seq1:408-950(-)